MGFLDLLDDPAILAGYRVRQLDGRSMGTLAARLLLCSVDGEPEGWVPLTEAMRAIGGMEKPWGSAFAMMLNTKALPFALRADSGTTFFAAADILVPPSAHEGLRDARFSRNEFPDFTFDELLTARDATSVLNIHDNKFTRIRREHFANAAAPDGRIAITAIVDAARHWVSPGELGARTGRTPHDCFTELSRTAIPRSLLGWPRSSAERYMGLRASGR